MKRVENRKTSLKLDPNNYSNNETGETLASELNNKVSMTLREDSNQFIINSNEYVVFDSAAIQYITNSLNNTDIGKLFTIADMVKGECSVLYQGNNHPHTSETLSLVLDMNLNKFYEFVRRLVKKNILCYCICSPSGHLQKIYMLNPYIARKRKNINCELKTFFRDVTKDKIVKKPKKCQQVDKSSKS